MYLGLVCFGHIYLFMVTSLYDELSVLFLASFFSFFFISLSSVSVNSLVVPEKDNYLCGMGYMSFSLYQFFLYWQVYLPSSFQLTRLVGSFCGLSYYPLAKCN